jgi:hypothetical protein
MGQITTVRAWSNNEVAYVAWDVDKKIKGCLGFDVTRVYLNDDGSLALRADGQRRPNQVRNLGRLQGSEQSKLASSGY